MVNACEQILMNDKSFKNNVDISDKLMLDLIILKNLAHYLFLSGMRLLFDLHEFSGLRLSGRTYVILVRYLHHSMMRF